MIRDPENQDAEQLTDEERAALAYLKSAYPERKVAKLLRIHDAQREHIAELEEEQARLNHNTAVDESFAIVATALLREWVDGKAPSMDTRDLLRNGDYVPERFASLPGIFKG